MRSGLPLLLIPLAAACTAVPQPDSGPRPSPPVIRPPVSQIPQTRPVAPPVVGFRAPQVLRLPGLEGVIEQGADGLTRQFGTPRLDVREGDMRKLQFAGEACVLDVFLYPMSPNAEAVATWLEARRASDGLEVDRLACVNALRRR